MLYTVAVLGWGRGIAPSFMVTHDAALSNMMLHYQISNTRIGDIDKKSTVDESVITSQSINLYHA